MQAVLPTQVSDAQVQTDVVSRTSEACQTDNPNGIDFQVQANIQPDRRTIGTETTSNFPGENQAATTTKTIVLLRRKPSSSGLNKAKKNTVPTSKAPSRKTNPYSTFEDTTFTGRIVSITPNRSGVGTCEIRVQVSEHIKCAIKIADCYTRILWSTGLLEFN